MDKDSAGRPLWARVRHGVVLPSEQWATLTPEQRHAAFVHATALQMKAAESVTFSHASAAALLQLPRVTAWPELVHVTPTGKPVRSSGIIRRHELPPGPTQIVSGLTVTTVARTIVDLARSEDLLDALAAADHALHHGLCDKAALEAELDTLAPGVTGRSRARLAIDLADGLAMSVGESLSRGQMFRNNIPRPQLQVRIEDADGLVGLGDFGWEGVIGEFDGRLKYKVPEGGTPDAAQEVLWKEKVREDRIRATGRRMARWVWRDAMTPARLLGILAAQGIRPTAKNTWFDDDVAVKHPRRLTAG